MLLQIKSHFQDILDKWVKFLNSFKFQDNFRSRDTFEISGQLGSLDTVLHPAQHMTGHYGDKSFCAISCTDTEKLVETYERKYTNNTVWIRPTDC